MTRKVGLIAGRGKLPRLFARSVLRRGDRAVAICVVDEATIDGAALDDGVETYRIFGGQWQQIIDVFKRERVDTVYFVGRFARADLYGRGEFDPRFLRLLSGISAANDDAIALAYVEDLEREGFVVGAQSDYLDDLRIPPGVMTPRPVSDLQWMDMERAYLVAKAAAGVDAGQTAVVKGGAVLAVEAVDGTDETILRGGRLAGEGAVAVKVAKPKQDARFDLPVLGLGTVEAAVEARLSVLAFEAAHAFFLEKEEALSLAERHGLTLVAYAPGMGRSAEK